MKTSTLVRGLSGLSALFLLSACQEGVLSTQTTPATGGTTPQAKVIETERDVDAPEVFSAQETGLWDGRPSFGGVWVAHPDVKEPERVRITNVATGQTIAGALFRREREFPGPRFQISSNAASALGILAGQPTELLVVVMRREVVTIVPPGAQAPSERRATEETDSPAAEEVIADSQDQGAAPTTETAEEALVEEAAPTPAELRRIKREEAAAKRKAEREARKQAREEAAAKRKAELEAKRAAEAEAKAQREAEAAAKREAEAAAKAADAEKEATKPLARPEQDDPIAAAAAAIDAAVGEAIESAPSVTEAPKPLTRPFLQLGTYSTQEEADEISEALRNAGLLPTVVERRFFNQSSWRIIVGPAATQEELDALQAKLIELGYDGIKPVRR